MTAQMDNRLLSNVSNVNGFRRPLLPSGPMKPKPFTTHLHLTPIDEHLPRFLQPSKPQELSLSQTSRQNPTGWKSHHHLLHLHENAGTNHAEINHRGQEKIRRECLYSL